MDNDYESINLASTLKSELVAKSPRRNQQQVPVSESESYDDDEFEHDPEEFITDKHSDLVHEPQLRDDTLHLSDQQADMLADSNTTLRLSSIHLSELMPPLHNKNFNEPMQYLSGRIKNLERNLLEQTQSYSALLRKGDSTVADVRSKIQQTFRQLSEAYLSLNELYSKDASYTKSVCTYFDAWGVKRDRVLDKIQRAKSVESTHGAKLVSLLNETAVVDDEIKELQKRITVLQEKKTVLNKEIEDTTSVLESRTAICGENLRYLESNGREVLSDYLSYNGFPDSDLIALIKERDVDLSFTMPEKIEQESKFIELKLPPQIRKQSDSAGESNVQESIGMKPYEPPSVSDEPTPAPHKQDESLMNHGHGPTPFEKGYATGAQNSRSIKTQLQNIIQKVLQRASTVNESQQKQNNMSTATLDIEPITTFLRLRVEALSDQAVNTTKMAALYHEYDKQWSQVQQIMALQEEKLEQILKESNATGDVTPVLQVLTQTQNQLESAYNSIPSKDPQSILSQLVEHEVDAVIEAVSMVAGQNHDRVDN
ncbi:hypothetical protein I9W82_001339 [Candida metapsilosis]|uniref:Uncharacterized protein n=1 Tax=Candida metapsilosis TaxID=273372 RepID=A0A8H7ZJZ9_9ASCO|nr:hypothetical protein I9W82_001339 [Candida metapsilosis]